jgi:hypothetical protein
VELLSLGERARLVRDAAPEDADLRGKARLLGAVRLEVALERAPVGVEVPGEAQEREDEDDGEAAQPGAQGRAAPLGLPAAAGGRRAAGSGETAVAQRRRSSHRVESGINIVPRVEDRSARRVPRRALARASHLRPRDSSSIGMPPPA